MQEGTLERGATPREAPARFSFLTILVSTLEPYVVTFESAGEVDVLSGGAAVRDGRGFGVSLDTTQGDMPGDDASADLISAVFEPVGGLTEDIGGTNYATLLTVFDSGAFTRHSGFAFNRVSAGGTFLVTVCPTASAPQFDDQVGDEDFFGDGPGTPGEDPLSSQDPDGQEADDPAFTDVRIGLADAIAARGHGRGCHDDALASARIAPVR
ncbi:MAG: hypothetical protein AAFX85_07480, partial [Pseudomonadota bacterium]